MNDLQETFKIGLLISPEILPIPQSAPAPTMAPFAPAILSHLHAGEFGAFGVLSFRFFVLCVAGMPAHGDRPSSAKSVTWWFK